MIELEIAKIVVGKRMRVTFEGIEELAESIDRLGQIQPIVVDDNFNLIAGERRLRAHILLKKPTISAIMRSDCTDLLKKEIELEENIKRKAFTWQEEVKAKAELHEIKQSLHGAAKKGVKDNAGKWQITDTAIALGESRGGVSMDIQLAKGIKAFPELAKEGTKSAAYKKLKQAQTRIINAELAKRMQGSKAIAHPEIINGDCIEQMLKMESESVDLILTDPPYGIDVDNAHTYKRMTIKDVNFNDSEFDTFDLLDKAFKEMYRVLKKDRHAYIFFAIDKYSAVLRLLLKHGFEVHNIPLIWDKGSGSYPSQMTSYVHSYEPFLHCWKGARKLNGTPRDIFQVKRVPSGSKIHPTQKPTELLRDLIGLSSSPGELVFDPFAGSGATIVAAKECQRRAIGVELNPGYYKAICARLGSEEETEVVEAEAIVVSDPDMDIDLSEVEGE